MFQDATHPIYAHEHRLTKLMSGAVQDARYTPYSGATLAEVNEDGSCQLSPSGLVLKDVTAVAILIGSRPNLEFLPQRLLKSLHANPNAQRFFLNGNPSRHPCFVAVDPATYEVVDADRPDQHLAPGLFAIGPLRGDNSVRYLLGEGLAIRRVLNQRNAHQSRKTQPA